MQNLFENILTASLYGSIIIACLLLLRPLLKRLPKKYLCLLWLLAFLRLLIPVDIRFSWSLQPDVTALTRPAAVVQPVIPDLPEPVPAVPEDAALPEDTEVVYGDAFIPPESIPEGLEDYYPPAEEVSEPAVINWNVIGFGIWAAVSAGLVLYSMLSFIRLKRNLREAVCCRDGVWECAGLETAFILGWIRPRVYLPMGLTGDIRHHLLRHERAHLQRKDHWLKLLGFLALAVHWFNPLVWAAWILLCRDMELACDEQVVKDMGISERKDYSAALLLCSTRKEHYLACPVAFGEVSVKTRILSVLNYRRPRFWFSFLGIVAIVFVAVFFMTSPAEEEPDLSCLNYKNAVSPAAEQKKVMAIYCVDSSICPGEVYGDDLAKLLDAADWRQRKAEPRDQSSPGSIEFIIEEDYRITLFDRKFARVDFGEEVRYYRIPGEDYEAAVRLLTDPLEREPTEEEILIERCQSAMEAIMYADAYHIKVSADLRHTVSLQDYYEAEYWKSGENRLGKFTPDEDISTAWRMEWQGKTYKKQEAPTWTSVEPHDWREEDFIELDESRLLPWFHFVDWNRHSFSVEHHEVSGDTEEITLHHSERDFDQHEYTMTFLLDKEGKLLRIDRNWVRYQGKACSGIYTTEFVSFDETEVAAEFEQTIERSPAVFLPDYQLEKEDLEERVRILEQSMLLQRCYDALTWHQAQGCRHTRAHVFYTGRPAEEEEVTAEYWQTPTQKLRKLSMEGREDGWLLEKKDTIYCMGIKPYYPQDISDYTQWVESVNTEATVMTTWLEEYKWDYIQIEFLRSEEQGGRTVITFRVNEPRTDNLGSSADYHDVTFCITHDNKLLWIDDHAIMHGQDGNADDYMVYTQIQIRTYDEDLVSERLNETLEEICFPY